MNKTKKKIIVALMGLTSILSVNAEPLDNGKAARHSNSNKVKLKGHPVTGWNKTYGNPATNLRFVGQLNFDVGGVYNPDGRSLPIGSDTSPDALMASYAAPDVYLAFFGVQNAENVPNQNILYADYPQIIKHDSQTGPLPQLSDNPDWFGKSNGAKNKDLTVADWVSIGGSMKLKCNRDGSSFYKLNISNAIPGGLYTMWGFYFDQDIGSLMPDYAFGGTSANVFTADRNGKIKGARDLNICLQDINREDRYVPVNMFLVYHPDGRVHASVGHPVNTAPFIGPGMIATPQLMFAMPSENF